MRGWRVLLSVLRSRKRRQRQSAGAARRSAQGNGSTLGDLATSSSSSPSAFVVGPPIILSPPLYDDIEGTDSRPPPYYQCLSSVGDGTQLSSVADLPSPLSVEPTAPPTQNHDLTNLSDEQPGASGMPAYSNPAYSDSGVWMWLLMDDGDSRTGWQRDVSWVFHTA